MELRWGDVAFQSGRTMHRLAQFHAVNRPVISDPPDPGNLSSDLLKVLCKALAEHTTTAHSCRFCLWEGYAWLSARSAARVHLPQRNYLPFEGPLEAATDLGWNMPGGCFCPQSPNLFWPCDQAWCVASEIDLFCTIVAGSNALAERLMADPRLEVWRVFADDPITADSDNQNR